MLPASRTAPDDRAFLSVYENLPLTLSTSRRASRSLCGHKIAKAQSELAAAKWCQCSWTK